MNTFISPTWVTTDTAMFFNNEVKLVGAFDRSYDESFRDKPEGAQIGYTVYQRIQQRFTTVEGDALVEQPLLNQTVPITINHKRHVGMGWSSVQKTLEVEEVQERYTKPAGMALANIVDVLCGAEVFQQVSMTIGLPGVTGSTVTGSLSNFQTWLDGVARLQNTAVPGPFIAVVDPKTKSKLVGSSFVQFNPQKEISEYFRAGLFATEALGIDEWMYDPNMPTMTTGTYTTSTPLVDGALQTGSTLVLKGFGTYSFLGGETFTLLGVDGTNPLSYIDTGDLQEFTVVSPVSGTGGVTLTVSPSIITSGPLQNVTASPANNAQVFFKGATSAVSGTLSTITSRQSLVFNKGAFAFVMVDLTTDCPGANVAFKRDKQAKISMRWTEQWNIQTDRKPSRCDIMWGSAAVLPYFAFRAWS